MDIRLAQKVLLEILFFIDQCCKEYNIEYWIDGGTLLGARRHGGFIPWDDDIDVCLLPEAHKKLTKIIKDKIKNGAQFILYNSVRPSPYITEYLSNYLVLQNNFYPYQVDVLMVKSVPPDTAILESDKSIINIIHYFHFLKYKNKECVLEKDKRHLKDGAVWKRRSRFFNFVSTEYVSTFSNKNRKNVYNYLYNDMYVTRDREYYTHEEIFPLKEIKFENHLFPCPSDTDAYLAKLYGPNYLILPPKEQQMTKTTSIRKNKFPIPVLKLILWSLYKMKDIKFALRFYLSRKNI